MGCDFIRLPGGASAVVCSRGRRPSARCSSCGRPGADLFCDGPKPSGRTCDAPVCRKCAHHVGANRDLCPSCVRGPSILGLTLSQPWAWAVTAGHVPLWNLGFHPPEQHVGRFIAIHAGGELEQLACHLLLSRGLRTEFKELPLGAVVAVARLARVVTESASPWFSGPFGLELVDVVPIEPVASSGGEGLWELEPGVLVEVRRRYGEAKS